MIQAGKASGSKDRRKNSKPAEIVKPTGGFNVPRRIRRLRRRAPMYALQ